MTVDERVVAPDDDVLVRLADEIEQIADGDLVSIAQALGEAAFRRRSDMDMLEGDLHDLATVVTGAAETLRKREVGETGVRIYALNSGATAIDVHTEDGPFLVSTLSEALSRRNLDVADLLHPILGVRRDESGEVTEIVGARHADERESWIHVRLTTPLANSEWPELERELVDVLEDAVTVTMDFGALKQRVKQIAAEAETDGAGVFDTKQVDEATAFLTWLLDDHFVLLGARDVRFEQGGDRPEVVDSSGLGIWKHNAQGSTIDPLRVSSSDSLLGLAQTSRPSTVHRSERMIHIALTHIESGAVVGERQLVGLLSQKAFAQPATSVPVLRSKLSQILELEDVVDHSHDERALRMLFEAIPKPELFTISTAELRTVLLDLLQSQKRQAVRVVIRHDEDRASALVSMPRDRFSADIRMKLQRLLMDRLNADAVDYRLSLTEADHALLHFAFSVEGEPDYRLDDLQREVVELSRTWEDRLLAAIGKSYAISATTRYSSAEEFAAKWSRLLPSTYTAATAPEEAVGDLAHLDSLLGGAAHGRVRVVAGEAGRLRVKLFKLGEGIELSTVLPMLESMGLVAIEEVPHRIELAGEGSDVAHIHAVEVRAPDLDELDVAAHGERLSEALLAIWNGAAAADSLNRLVLLAGLDWDDVAILRAYRRYRRQVGTSFTESYQNEALCQYPEVATGFVRLFRAMFAPREKQAEDTTEKLRAEVSEALEQVSRLDQDRILRGYLGLIEATLRTNAFITPRRPWLSIKFDSTKVPGMPKPVPYREIFVYSPRMEGIHLRGGPVARGGLRWSDRLEDVRTEVLGLMKAQVTKNAMIVPTGSKGGFVIKQPPTESAGLQAEVEAQYEVFIRGMLDLTDNVVDGEVVHPEDVRAPDGEDSYLVVAADKGTATFSDLANSISQEYDYWLDDAFASGGSRGYDHKAMAITARGAWETVRRHFYELDIDVQAEPITIVGIGDMSGDVFGNGLLQSRAVKLIAAFDHRDIFIDPEPDPEASFEERDRLYNQPRSTWQDYDRERISDGGGVWSRTVKSIPLSDEMRSWLRVDDRAMPPPQLLRTILQAPSDLLFAGGIGTVVKSEAQSNDDVGDRANDAIRVDAAQVGARVIGEGGNLAVTQPGRIEYARRGGRINLDAIDNAAGVATSDAEVNLKILLQLALERGELDDAGRDEALEEVRDDVARQVLHMVWRQAWAISREMATSPGGMEAYEQLMVDLDESGRADRRVDVLPSSSEMQRRREVGAGMTRPELGMLLGASKQDLTVRLLDSDVPDDPALRPLLRDAFPDTVAQRFDHLLDDHRLRRELVATRLASEIVDRLGITYISRTAHERGCMAADVVRGYWVARQVVDAPGEWRAIDKLQTTVVPALQLELTAEIDTLMDACTRAYLRQLATSDMGELIASDEPAFHQLRKYVEELEGSLGAQRRGRVGRWVDVGLEDDLAERIATLRALTIAPDVAGVARRQSRDVHTVADAFVMVTEMLPLEVLHTYLEDVTPVGNWERWQLRALVDELREIRRQTAAAALAASSDTSGVDGAKTVRSYIDERSSVITRVNSLVKRLDRESDHSLAAVTVVMTALRGVLD